LGGGGSFYEILPWDEGPRPGEKLANIRPATKIIKAGRSAKKKELSSRKKSPPTNPPTEGTKSTIIITVQSKHQDCRSDLEGGATSGHNPIKNRQQKNKGCDKGREKKKRTLVHSPAGKGAVNSGPLKERWIVGPRKTRSLNCGTEGRRNEAFHVHGEERSDLKFPVMNADPPGAEKGKIGIPHPHACLKKTFAQEN